jgi:hypothetical protein
MNPSTQRHGNLYKSKEVLHMHQKIQGGMETRSINRGFIWQSTSPQYRHNHEEWDEDLDNNEVE